jgi:hypothetical protein
MSDDAPKLHIDSDWKAEAQAEKERLAAQAATKSEAKAAGGPGELPPADFQGLMGILVSQAIMGLGAYTDPESGGVVIDLPGSRFAIDLLAVLEEKTKGNLSDDEAKELSAVLGELRSRFVQIAQLVAQQQAAGGGMPGPGAAPASPGPDLRIQEP